MVHKKKIMSSGSKCKGCESQRFFSVIGFLIWEKFKELGNNFKAMESDLKREEETITRGESSHSRGEFPRLLATYLFGSHCELWGRGLQLLPLIINEMTNGG